MRVIIRISITVPDDINVEQLADEFSDWFMDCEGLPNGIISVDAIAVPT